MSRAICACLALISYTLLGFAELFALLARSVAGVALKIEEREKNG